MIMLLSLASLFLTMGSALAIPIPSANFAGLVFAPPLQDRYQTGDAILIAGQVADGAKADGQLLLRFTPADGSEVIQVFVNLVGVEFRHYHIFTHDLAGRYVLDLFLGGPEESQLSYVGNFDDFSVDQNSGPIHLPVDYFTGVLFDEPLATEFRTSTAGSLAGEVIDPALANGHILFNFIHLDSGEEFPLFIDLEGQRFRRGLLFEQDGPGPGDYELSVFIGQQGAGSLAFVSRFVVALVDDGVPTAVPVDYFIGVLFDEPLPIEWPVDRDFSFRGSVAAGVGSLRINLISAAGERTLTVPVAAGRFSLSLRLGRGELGRIELQLTQELADGLLRDSGSFEFIAVEPPLAPILALGAVALGLLPGGEHELILSNLGPVALAELRFEIEGPFSVVDSPSVLASGLQAAAVIRYDGAGGDHGVLLIYSDDPERPVRRVALHGLQSGAIPRTFVERQADRDGLITLDLDLDRQDYALVLYAGEVAALNTGLRYPYALGGMLPAARRATGLAQVGWAEKLRQRERIYAERFRAYRGPLGKKTTALQQVGQRREFIFEENDGVAGQRIAATLVAVSPNALGWLQDDLRFHEDNIDAVDIAAIIEQFSAEDYASIIAAFGRPSDVDADGRISFLITHLVDDLENVAGFYAAGSVLPIDSGGDGNLADLLFISPTQPRDSYRSLLVHEFQHLINFNEHVLERRGAAEVSWLNEGLSHLAEDLVAGYAASGQSDNIAAFLHDPEAVGLEPEADDDSPHRGAAYLFVRSLVDRMGPAVILRLVGSGVADRANVEKATGESFAELLAAWGTQLYISGLGLSDHPRFNYATELLRAGETARGFPLPRERDYVVGGPGIGGMVPQRGLAFVRVSGSQQQSLEIAKDPQGQLAVVAIPVARNFIPSAFVPADYVPGLRFTELVPAVMVGGRNYTIRGEVTSGEIGGVVLSFAGADTLDFFAEFSGTSFSATIELLIPGEYELNFFTGQGGGESLDFAVGFGPIWVRDENEPTAVAAELGGVPQKFSLGTVYPNPFNSSAILPLFVPEQGGEIAVEIFNVLGQKVRNIHAGNVPAGRVTLAWDGRNDGGSVVASGVYFIQVQAPAFAAVRRLVFLQ